MVGSTNQKVTEPEPRGARVAAYVEAYLAVHHGLSHGELAFRLHVDKRDLQRLIRDHSCGWRLEDNLAAYFGDDFVDHIFRPVIGTGPSRRQKELDRERAEITARAARLQHDREARREGRSFDPPGPRLVPDEGGKARV